jgi:hypothetical protein
VKIAHNPPKNGSAIGMKYKEIIIPIAQITFFISFVGFTVSYAYIFIEKLRQTKRNAFVAAKQSEKFLYYFLLTYFRLVWRLDI